jgi:SHS2 domain-containing protein
MEAPFFEVLEHPADIGFRVYGDTLPALFVHSALAMLSIAGEPASVVPREGFSLAAESGDRESLLVDWLSEVLYWYDGKRVAFHDFRVLDFEDHRIRAIGIGEPREPHRHISRLIVKAVTYHQLKLELRQGIWVAEVFLDI